MIIIIAQSYSHYFSCGSRGKVETKICEREIEKMRKVKEGCLPQARNPKNTRYLISQGSAPCGVLECQVPIETFAVNNNDDVQVQWDPEAVGSSRDM